MSKVRKDCPDCKGLGVVTGPDPFGGPVPMRETCRCVDECEMVKVEVDRTFVEALEAAADEHERKAESLQCEGNKAFEAGATFAYRTVAEALRKDLERRLNELDAVEMNLSLLALMETTALTK